ncbi:alpha/beta hydrolase [Sinomonas sp.]|uniref:alpha/beta hydrolase n=1 Tax=Sinomonas sp. TaxID=1914986 RepID=UPI003F7D18E3
MPLDAASQRMLEAMRATNAPPLHQIPLAEARARALRNLPALADGPTMSHEEDVLIDSAAPVVVRVFKPAPTTRGVILVFHGGGWVLGNVSAVTPMSRHLAQLAEMTVVAVEYRKAPEHRYPAAVDDAVRAVDWAVAHRDRLTGCPGAPVAVLGESAGGNLAAAAALCRSDVLAAQVLCCPVTDHTMDYPSYQDPSNQLTLTSEAMAYFWNRYLPEAARRSEPRASPLRAVNLAGAPPAMVILAEYDILRDEGRAYADGLAAAGVPVLSHVAKGQMHGFLSNVNVLPAALSTLEAAAAFLRMSGRRPLLLQSRRGDAHQFFESEGGHGESGGHAAGREVP